MNFFVGLLMFNDNIQSKLINTLENEYIKPFFLKQHSLL